MGARAATAAVVESGKLYDPDYLMSQVGQWRRTTDEYLRNMEGITPLIPNYGDGLPSAWSLGVYGLYHCELWGGTRNVTLMRCGDTLYQQAGWDRGVAAVVSGLQAGAGRYPDTFVRFGDRVIWLNGLDRPHIYDGEVAAPLGYVSAPAAPYVRGPLQTPTSATESNKNPAVYRNNAGYSHPGRIGTPGDALDGQWGAVLAGTWYYRVQWEDAFGNLSPLSAPSNPVDLRTEQTAQLYQKDFLAWNVEKPLGQYAVHMEDIQRQFFVRISDSGPDATVATRLYRTRDTRRDASTYHFVARVGGQHAALVYPDNIEDAHLGAEATEVLPVPNARLACAHSGRLVLANAPTEPGALWVSEVGAPGTLPVANKLYPDSAGAEITGVCSFQGSLLAFTERHCHAVVLTDIGVAASEIASAGCLAPGSLVNIGKGGIVWLGPEGVVFWAPGGVPTDVSQGIADILRVQNPGRARLACAVWDELTGEYLIAVSVSGGVRGNLLLGWDGSGWRRYAVPPITSMATTVDWRRYVLLGTATAVYVFDTEDVGNSPPLRRPWFLSRWLTYDPEGRVAFNFEELAVAFVGAATGKLSLRVWRDNDPANVVAESEVPACDVLDVAADSLVIGTDSIAEDGLVWRKMSLAVQGCRTVRFELVSDQTQKLRIAGFTLSLSPVDPAGDRVRV